MGLRQFTTDRPAAQHQQMTRPFIVVEDGLVGEVRHPVQTGHGRNHRRGTGCNDEAPGTDPERPCLHLARPGEGCSLAQHGRPETLEALLRIMRRDGCDDTLHMITDLLEVGARGSRLNAEPSGMTRGMGGMRGCDQGFGRDAAVVQAVAAHLAALDQDGVDAKLCRGGGDAQSAGACANDAEVRVQRGIR